MNNKRGNVNLSSCTNCGLVVDLKNIKYIPIELPDNPKEVLTAYENPAKSKEIG